MVNFGPLAAEIVSLVWGTPANFNGFHFLAALLHGTLVAGVSQTVALNRGRHLYSAWWPSPWTLAHISSYYHDHDHDHHFSSSFMVSTSIGVDCMLNYVTPFQSMRRDPAEDT